MKKEKPLVERWNACDDEEIAAFIRLISGAEIPKFILDDLNAKVAEDKRRLVAIKKNKLFKLLMSDQSFAAAYKWLDASHAPAAYKVQENRSKIIACMVIPFTIYARHIGGKKPLPLHKECNSTTKKINKKAQALLDVIRKHNDTLDDLLKRCCNDSLKRLTFMAEYELIKPPSKNKTFNERAFLHELVTWLYRYNLPRAPKFIGLLLQMLGNHRYRPNKRKLTHDIRISEEKYATVLKRSQRGWE